MSQVCMAQVVFPIHAIALGWSWIAGQLQYKDLYLWLQLLSPAANGKAGSSTSSLQQHASLLHTVQPFAVAYKRDQDWKAKHQTGSSSMSRTYIWVETQRHKSLVISKVDPESQIRASQLLRVAAFPRQVCFPGRHLLLLLKPSGTCCGKQFC